MYLNYIKIAIRNLLRHKTYAVINILGLSVGMAASIFIFLIVAHHLSFDEHFTHYQRIYRVNVSTQFEKQARITPKTPILLSKTLEKYSSDIEKTCQILKGSHKLISYKTAYQTLNDFYYSDQNFNKVFDLKIIKGEKINPLQDSGTIILTQETANNLFKNENPIGKTLELDNGWKYRVSAVCEALPANTHFHFSALADLKYAQNEIKKTFQFEKEYQNWQNDMISTYFLLKENGSIQNVKKALNDIYKKEIEPHLQEFTGLKITEYYNHGNYYHFKIQKLSDIHTSKDIENEFESTYPNFYFVLFISIALLILILASINFMNLTTARSSTRSIEIAVRKIAGASRKQLIFQFLIESILVTFISLLFALALLELTYSPNANYASVYQKPIYLIYIVAFTTILGFFSGFYPAFYLSSISTIHSLQGKASLGVKSLKLRRFLVVFQLTITFIILISRDVIIQQIDFFNQRNFNFKNHDIYIIKRAYALDTLKYDFINEIAQNKNIISACYLNTIPGEDENMFPVALKDGNKKLEYMSEIFVSKDFIKTFNINEIQKSDSVFHSEAISINQQAAKLLKIKDLTDSTRLTYFLGNTEFKNFKIVSILQDFHFQALYHKIKPTVIRYGKENDYYKYLAIRIKKENSAQTIEYVKDKWKKRINDNIFEKFLIQIQLVELYKKELNTAVLFIIFSVLAVIIALLGIFGLSAFTTVKRTREIGIRKVFGTPIYKIVFLLSFEFIKWLFISFVLAAPISYFIMTKWLERFAYHIEFDTFIYFKVGIFMFVITLSTVVLYVFRAARKNPAQSLRHE